MYIQFKLKLTLHINRKYLLRMWEGEVICECRPTAEERRARDERIALRRLRIAAKLALE